MDESVGYPTINLHETAEPWYVWRRENVSYVGIVLALFCALLAIFYHRFRRQHRELEKKRRWLKEVLQTGREEHLTKAEMGALLAVLEQQDLSEPGATVESEEYFSVLVEPALKERFGNVVSQSLHEKLFGTVSGCGKACSNQASS